jgi:site-specific recombinase XerD
MIEDMTIRKLAPKTQRDYVQRIKNFAAFLGRSPDTATFEDVRLYQLHLAASGVGAPTLNQAVSTLRFFFKVTLRRHDIVEHTHFIHEARKLPAVLSPEEVARLLDAAPGLKYKAALSVAYGAGLRAAEVVSLFAAYGRFPHLRQKNHARQRRQPMHPSASTAVTQLCRSQIPIALGAPPPATSRGFVH